MSNNGRFNLLIVLALLIGVSGVSLGAYSAFFQGPVAGVDGKDAPGGVVVGILDPDAHDMVSGVIEIRALIAGSNQYSVSVLRNASEIGTQLPLSWDTTSVADGWWNITVKVLDIPSGNHTQDEVIVYVMNMEEDVPIYYCASEEEINDALADIGSGSGTITIIEDIILNSSISINGGGSYVLQGIAPSINIDCNGDRTALQIETSSSCVIRDLTINATDITSNTRSSISVYETLTFIENIRIFGDEDRKGIGISIYDDNVWITNCYISQLYYGIRTLSNSHISDNTILYCDADNGKGIYLDEGYSTCGNNYVAYCFIGITIRYKCTVSNNILIGNTFRGIRVIFHDNTISGNIIQGLIFDSGIFGIEITGNNNIIMGNKIYYSNTGTGSRGGIWLFMGSYNNSIIGNTIQSCDTAIRDQGTNSYIINNNIF
ncbi:MAG: hypothetical protein ACQERB_12910 [Promethearchaeati archaeon]